jgi:hypothetical protein
MAFDHNSVASMPRKLDALHSLCLLHMLAVLLRFERKGNCMYRFYLNVIAVASLFSVVGLIILQSVMFWAHFTRFYALLNFSLVHFLL